MVYVLLGNLVFFAPLQVPGGVNLALSTVGMRTRAKVPEDWHTAQNLVKGCSEIALSAPTKMSPVSITELPEWLRVALLESGQAARALHKSSAEYRN
jgi:hypothetical protein